MENPNDNRMLQASDGRKKHESEPGLHTDGKGGSDRRRKWAYSIWIFILAMLFMMFVNMMVYRSDISAVNIDYSKFKSLIDDGTIVQVAFDGDQYIGYAMTKEDAAATLRQIAATRQIPHSLDSSSIIAYQTYVIDDPGFVPLLDEKGVEYYATEPPQPSVLGSLISLLFPVIIFMVFYWWLSKRIAGQAQGVMSFNQNRSKLVAEGDTGVKFADVAGEDEAKAELVEVVDFLRRPEKYTEMGAHIPKGVLLVGPPGTGKTLLAKAVAGEAGVPFFRMSGADFVEMFVGVGAARVRDLFKQAKEKSPCIIFIDEIDAIGRQRSAAGIGGNDEREQTLNQLLVEMDGFDSRTGVIILAATNRPEILDPALLRPGRFDRQVLVDKPDLDGREQILKIHTKGMKLAADVDLRKIAQASAGLAGADLANIANEAALLAVRENRQEVVQTDFENAIEKSIAGLERKSRVLNEKERTRVAYHETGHALVAAMQSHSAPVQKITIIPRTSGALGYTMQVDTGDKYLMTKEEIENKIATYTGGRAAEEVIFGEITTGASNDIEQATKLARAMITRYGMSDSFGMVALETVNNQYLGGDASMACSADTQNAVDREVMVLVEKQHQKARKILEDNKEKLNELAKYLYEKETITGDEFMRILEGGAA